MTPQPTTSTTHSTKRAPQIVMLLDDDARVINVNRSLAGKSFESVTDESSSHLHDLLHPECNGNCRFADLWNKAWLSLDSRETVEWELDDSHLSRLLRLNLTVPPSEQEVENERRRRQTLLTITDITKYRREYESLIEREQALARLLLEQGVDIAARYPDPSDSGGAHNGRQNPASRSGGEQDARVRTLSRHVIRAQENERRRIASDLHDGLAQTLGVTKFQVEAAVDKLRNQDDSLDLGMFDDVVKQLKSAVEEVRRISSNLAPSMLDDFGICVALEWLCKECQSSIPEVVAHCDVSVAECELPDLVKIAIYRVAQEGLNNASRHANASQIDVSLRSDADGVELTITDDGQGFDPQQARLLPTGKGGLGLRNMRERVAATGGQFSLNTGKGSGTAIRAYWAEAELQLLADEAVLDGVDGYS